MLALNLSVRQCFIATDDFGTVQTVAGVDVGFEEDDRIACAAIAVLKFPDLTIQESVAIRRPTTFPYIPGLLGFREVPIVIEALAMLKTQPSLLLCDSNGHIHRDSPRTPAVLGRGGIGAEVERLNAARTSKRLWYSDRGC